MITRINENKSINKTYFKCKLDGRKCNSNQEWNNDKRQFECKNPIDFLYAKKIEKCLEFHYWNSTINGR